MDLIQIHLRAFNRVIPDVIANIEMLYQLATGINEPATELVEGLKLVTEFVQDENATQEDYTALERKLNDLKRLIIV